MLTPFPSQISGAVFLAGKASALLADEPRVGKTGAAIMACDLTLAQSILVVTTASGRAVWRRAFGDWSQFPRTVSVLTKDTDPATTDIVIVSWNGTVSPKIRAKLLARDFDRVILDESHYAKSVEAKRTHSTIGAIMDDGAELVLRGALCNRASGRVWYLTGTPMPNAPNDLYPMLRASNPQALRSDPERGWPDVTKYNDFLHRYCVVKMKKLSNFRKIPVVIGGRNLPELKARIDGFMLLRTQQDVGIREPIHELMPLAVSPAMRRAAEADVNVAEVLAAAEANDTKTLEMHMGPLRRLTGALKAKAVVEAVKEEFECGTDKIVLAYWHKEVGDALAEGLATYGVLQIDGSTPAKDRGQIEQEFLHNKSARVFLGQIAAAGEALDLSAAATLWFVETSFVPAQMKQMSLRITNYTQARQAVVRVCVLEGSIDEALQLVLLRKWTAIREVLQ